MSDGPTIPTDVLVIGGGIAGLWTLHALRRAGFNAMLIEHRALGAGQTIWSQGIIHGGIKYALTGAATEAARAVARMPEVWRACLEGKGEADLASVKPLSRSQVLWTTPGVVSRVAGAVASRAIRTSVRQLARDARPAAFAGAAGGVDVYEVDEPVLPVAPVLAALRDAHVGSVWGVSAVTCIEQRAGRTDETRACVQVEAVCRSGTMVRLEARAVVLAAGAGNEALAQLAGFPDAGTIMQRRPLHMVMARGGGGGGGEGGVVEPLPELFGHCLSASSTPRLTITTVDRIGAERVWLIGGAIAEAGAQRDGPAQVRAAAVELRSCLPWVDFSRIRLATGRIDRAEGRTPGGARPDEPVIVRRGRVFAAWPTKLALAPVLAARLVEAIGTELGEQRGGHPADHAKPFAGPPALAAPDVARPPWIEAGVVWHAA